MKTALLNKLRNRLEGVFQKLAYFVSKTGLTPNILTIISLLVALVGFFLVIIYKSGVLLSIAILLSGFIDILDGALARLQARTTPKGAFLDSFNDRVCEILFALCFIELGLDPRIVIVFATSSMMISYARARGENMGIQLSGVGFMERAERLILMALVGFLLDLNFIIAHLVYLLATLLTVLTVIQRFVFIWKKLS